MPAHTDLPRAAALIDLASPFHPVRDRVVLPVRAGLKLSRVVRPRLGEQPTVVVLNGRPVLRAHWRRVRLARGDVVLLVRLPQGGGDSNPLQIVLMIAVMAVAWYAAPALAGALGIGKVAAAGLITALGNAVVSLAVPPPKPTTPQLMRDMAQASPAYSVGAQGNTARLSQPIPVVYGRNRLYPDFAAAPYIEYAEDEQYLYQLLVLGWGEFQVHSVAIEDTELPGAAGGEPDHALGGPFPGTLVEWLGPSQRTSRLFPARVYTVPEVSGQDAEHDVVLGPFDAVPEGAAAHAIHIDIVCPRGLYYAADNGELEPVTVRWEVTGLPGGTRQEVLTLASSGAVRRSYRYPVPSGRYSIGLRRTSAADGRTRVADDISWVGLRASLDGEITPAGTTRLAIRLVASNALSSQSARRINVDCTRRLRTWSADTGWSAPVATRAIAWAFADACLSAEYGGRLPASRLALPRLATLDAVWASRGDRFDFVFDQRLPLEEALTHIARAGRAVTWTQGGLRMIERDGPPGPPVALFSPRNIVPGTLEIEYLMPSENTADALDVTYWDRARQRPIAVRAALPGSVAATPGKLAATGISEREHAWREGMYTAACNRYRRKLISFETEAEGLLLSPLDPVGVKYDLLNGMGSGDVRAADGIGVGARLRLSEPVAFAQGAVHKAGFRGAAGELVGPVLVTPGRALPLPPDLAELPPDLLPAAYTDELVLSQALPDGFAWSLAGDREPSHYVFGTTETVLELCRIIPPIQPSGLRVRLTAVTEHAAVHTADQGIAPVLPASAWQLDKTPLRPVVGALIVRLSKADSAPYAILSWRPVAGADFFLIETSVDGAEWVRVAEPSAPPVKVPVRIGTLRIRVAAVGRAQGPWSEWSGDLSAIALAPGGVSGLRLAEPWITPDLHVTWLVSDGAVRYDVQVRMGAIALRTESVESPGFRYSHGKQIEDGGPRRRLVIAVRAVSAAGVATEWVTLECFNAPPAVPASIALVPTIGGFAVTVAASGDPDYVATLIWWAPVSEGPNFPLDDVHLLYDGPQTQAWMADLPDNAEYYVRVAQADIFGREELVVSPAMLVKAQPRGGVRTVQNVPVAPPGEGEQPVVYVTSENSIYYWSEELVTWRDVRVDGAQILNELIVAQDVVARGIAAISANLGSVVAGNLTLNGAGFIRGGQAAPDIGAGYFLGHFQDRYHLTAANLNNDRLVFNDQGLRIDGALTINSGAEVELIANNTFASLDDWFDARSAGDTSAALSGFTLQIRDDRPVAQLDSTAFTTGWRGIVSRKVAIQSDETLRVRVQLNGADTPVSRYWKVGVVFSSNPGITTAAIGLDFVDPAEHPDVTLVENGLALMGWHTVDVDVAVPFADPPYVWASLLIAVSVG